jgi:hypothetical protein
MQPREAQPEDIWGKLALFLQDSTKRYKRVAHVLERLKEVDVTQTAGVPNSSKTLPGQKVPQPQIQVENIISGAAQYATTVRFLNFDLFCRNVPDPKPLDNGVSIVRLPCFVSFSS